MKRRRYPKKVYPRITLAFLRKYREHLKGQDKSGVINIHVDRTTGRVVNVAPANQP